MSEINPMPEVIYAARLTIINEPIPDMFPGALEAATEALMECNLDEAGRTDLAAVSIAAARPYKVQAATAWQRSQIQSAIDNPYSVVGPRYPRERMSNYRQRAVLKM